MKIGLLLCDDIHETLQKKYISYASLFDVFLSKNNKIFSLEIYCVKDGILPQNTHECDAWIISGSKNGVYEPLPWIKNLEYFVLDLFQAQAKTIGICFGHQLIAKAMGGTVKKFDKGWAIGMSTNQMLHHQHWMQPKKSSLNLLVSHQDQVVKLPENSQLLASNAFCENYMIQYQSCFLSLQGHPEFTKNYSLDAILARKEAYSDALISQAKNSLKLQHENNIIHSWLWNFLEA